MGDDSGRQSGWYTVGGTLTAAGCTLFPLGLTSNPQSQTLQLLGFLAFVGGLTIIFCAMIDRRAVGTGSLAPGPGQPTGQATHGGALRPQGANAHNTPPGAPVGRNQPVSPRF